MLKRRNCRYPIYKMGLYVFLTLTVSLKLQAQDATGNSFRVSDMPCRDSVIKTVNQAITIIQRDYYRRNEIDWSELDNIVKERLNNLSSCDEGSDILSWYFGRLNEKHSFIMPAPKASEYTGKPLIIPATNEVVKPSLRSLMGTLRYEVLPDKTGYLTLPWLSSTDPEVCTRYIDSVHSVIATLDQQGVQKWIIDLRTNTGGNCWPMLAGIGPLLGEGVCGYFVFPDSRKPWVYKNGAAYHGNNKIAQAAGEGYKLGNPPQRCSDY